MKFNAISYALIVCLTSPCRASAATEAVELTVRTHTIHAELAVTESSRTTGLMYRKSLCQDCGMLFVFPSADQWAFWSKNTPLALSVAFIDDGGRIVQIVDMEAQSTKNHASNAKVRYALEMSRGWFLNKGLAAGDVLSGIPGMVSLPHRMMK